MSFTPPPQPGSNFKGPIADDATRRREQAIRRSADLNRNEEGIAERRPRPSVAERVKRLLRERG